MRYDAFSQCHPLTNFVFFLGAIGCSVVIQHPAFILASCLCGGIYGIALNGRRGGSLLLGMIPVFLVLSALNPLLSVYGDHTLFTVFGRPYNLESLLYGMAVSGIFVAMILWFGCYSAVLTSDKFVCLFGSLIPSISMLLVMVLRMIPNLMRRTGQIAGARKSIGKGAGEQSTLKEKLTDGMNILSALTDWALEGSIVTADSMRARGYGAAKRSSFQIYRFTLLDGGLLIVQGVLLLAVLLSGGKEASFTPQIQIDKPGWSLVLYTLYLLIPMILHVKEAVQWRISISRI